MKQRNVLLAIVLVGSCVGVAPTWSQTSQRTQPGDTPVADKKIDKQDQGKLQDSKQSGTSGQSDPTAKAQRTQPGDTPVADKQDKSMQQSSGESSTMDRRTARVDIKKIQEALKDKGNDPGTIDGKLGPKTREALKSFQTANKLPATGRIDNETAKQLGVEPTGSSTAR